jgi:RNA polymerase sigma-70 factor (ECF subfamily)
VVDVGDDAEIADVVHGVLEAAAREKVREGNRWAGVGVRRSTLGVTAEPWPAPYLSDRSAMDKKPGTGQLSSGGSHHTPRIAMTDEDLVTGCVACDPKAQKALYQRYVRKMMSICMRYANGREQAQDMLQDGFVKVFQKIGHYRGEGPLGGWIARTMVNTCLDHIRRNKPYDHSVDLTEAEHLHQEDATVLTSMSTEELLELIQALPPGYRTVFNLFAIEGYPHKEISEMLGISENTSKSQFMKARAYLRKLLPREAAAQYGLEHGEG